MPIVRVTVIEGYEDEVRQRLARALTQAVRSTIAAPIDAITVAIEEVKPANYMRGGRTRVPGPALPDPAVLVRGFLEAMEARDLARASGFLAPEFRMTFPGGATFSSLEELIAWAKPRYRFVRKSYDRFETLAGDSGSTVYCYGTLAGEWPDGTAFSGIRFIDRFELRDGLIVGQMVWNDLAESAR
ncbi:tautomerase family protein [Polymorphum gilvum]|uniref:Tautomerase, putative n=1 Tax=Polymorphum gilvum (strain LMG 25793 / CGMCC 1.9160 / SL003B-26A1) TaxID=991905 RepID=F2J4K8_POLGS|nr:tautomerase family protein [Polymorphum gilvum]ADZ72260.1 Tautomerase, putative [Polymorphum gilvum SL003B-26A1]